MQTNYYVEDPQLIDNIADINIMLSMVQVAKNAGMRTVIEINTRTGYKEAWPIDNFIKFLSSWKPYNALELVTDPNEIAAMQSMADNAKGLVLNSTNEQPRPSIAQVLDSLDNQPSNDPISYTITDLQSKYDSHSSSMRIFTDEDKWMSVSIYINIAGDPEAVFTVKTSNGQRPFTNAIKAIAYYNNH